MTKTSVDRKGNSAGILPKGRKRAKMDNADD